MANLEAAIDALDEAVENHEALVLAPSGRSQASTCSSPTYEAIKRRPSAGGSWGGSLRSPVLGPLLCQIMIP
jgi:hypothetical protein